ncbi:hypothetical protein ACOMHN_031000 [Nucella lapillus]
MASKGKKSTSKLPSDWRIHMFSDIYCTDEESEPDFSFDNPIRVGSQWNLEKETTTMLHGHSPETDRKQSVRDLIQNGASSTCSAEIHAVNNIHSASFGTGLHGLKAHRRNSPEVDIREISLSGDTREKNNDQPGQKFPTSALLHEERGWDEDSRRRRWSQSITKALINRPGSQPSLDDKTRETTEYLPADDTVETPKAEKKPKGWEKLRSILRRKGKESTGSEQAQELEMVERTREEWSKKTKKGIFRGRRSPRGEATAQSDDLYTVTGQDLPLCESTHQSAMSLLLDASPSEGSTHKKRERRPSLSPIPLKRRTLGTRPATNSDIPIPSSSFSLLRPPSPLMPMSVGTYGVEEDDDNDSDTSSVTSDSPASSENMSDSGESCKGGGGGHSVGGLIANLSRGTVKRTERETEYCVKSDPQPVSFFQVTKIPDQLSSSPLISTKCAGSQSNNEALSGVQLKGPYGRLFTAKFFKRLGRDRRLNNVTNVSHVYRGTVLVTELISGKLLHVASSGRVMKRFEVDAGSEPWCACVTPRGHVAVTIKHPACVTVWSGSGALLQEFGSSVLQSPTGLACDREGNFIVADERANRVYIFSSEGHFLRCLTHPPPVCNNNNKEDKCAEESSTTCDNQSVNDNKENSLNKQGDSGTPRAKKRVRIKLDSPEIIIVDPNDDLVHQEKISTSSKTPEKFGSKNTYEEDTPEPYVFSFPRYVCVSASGHIIVSNSGGNNIKVFTPEGTYLRTIGSSGSKDGQLKVPYGVCCDQDDNIYVADHYNDRISVFSVEGEFIQHALTAVSGLGRPKSVTIRPARVPKLFVAHGGLRSMEVLVYCLEVTPRCVSFTCDL